MIIAVNFQFKQLERRSLKKNQGFNGIRTRDLRDTGAMLYQLRFTAVIILRFDLQPQLKYMNYFIYTSPHFTPHGRYELNKLTSLPMCGFTAQLVEHRTGIAEFTGSNPVEALIFFRLLLSNCLNWKFTAMIILHFDLQPQLKYMNYFIYTSHHFTPHGR